MILALCITSSKSTQLEDNTKTKINVEQFNTLFRTGNITINNNDVISINSDTEFLVKNKAHGIQYLQPVNIINGIMFCYKNSINTKGTIAILKLPIFELQEEHKEFLTKLFVEVIEKEKGYIQKISAKKLPFPNYPVVNRDSIEEQISLQYITSLFRATIQNLNNSENWLMLIHSPTFKNLKDDILGEFAKSPTKFPEILCTVMKICKSSEQFKFNYDPRKFKQDMESLFYMMYFLHANYLNTDPTKFNIEPFLKDVSDIRERLRLRFTENIPVGKYKDEIIINNKPINRMLLINNLLNCLESNDSVSQDKKVEIRNSTAKALMMDTLTHVDQSPGQIYSQILNMKKEDKLLVKNYGQMANFINHIQEHKHVYKEGDKIPTIPEKSYFILPKGKTIVDFYDTLYSAIIDAEDSYDINNVQIHKSNQFGKAIDLIDVDIEFSVDVQKRLSTYMACTNGIDKLMRTSIIRFKIAGDNGIYNLISAYPTQKKYATVKGSETQETIYKSLSMLFLDRETNERAQKKQEGKIYVINES